MSLRKKHGCQIFLIIAIFMSFHHLITFFSRVDLGLHIQLPTEFQSVQEFKVSEMYRIQHNRIDGDNIERCGRYGLNPWNNVKSRRIFFGALIADENWDVFKIHAIEAYDIYHLAVFVESNATFMNTPRRLRFNNTEEEFLLRYSKIFGKQTKVIIDLWTVDLPHLVGMTRESEQRNEILKRWKQQGMTTEDVGILSDVDEMFSRDFLRAIQSCDFPELRPNQDCQIPKVIPSSIFFESSPYCIKKAPWYHPDVISGECIDGIGDPTERVVPLREHRRRFGERHRRYGRFNPDFYPRYIKKIGRYPLFNGPDFRTVTANRLRYNFVNESYFGPNSIIGAAYHIHNWFTDLKILRHKYMTYGHPDPDVMKRTLSQMARDLYLLVRCVKGLGNDVNLDDNWTKFYEEGKFMTGNRPIFFLNETYLSIRHEMIKHAIALDEGEYGTNYDEYGNWTEQRIFPNVKE